MELFPHIHLQHYGLVIFIEYWLELVMLIKSENGNIFKRDNLTYYRFLFFIKSFQWRMHVLQIDRNQNETELCYPCDVRCNVFIYIQFLGIFVRGIN